MQHTAPEKKGIASAHIAEYIRFLEAHRIAAHSLLIARGNDLVYEGYWKPFHGQLQHRMYSVSKSVVGLAIGFLQQDGLVDLDTEIQQYFPEECKAQTDENMRRQTVRDMLMMSTAKTDRNWFPAKPADRVQYYFENPDTTSRPGGLFFRYDSTGSFVLGALVERLTGKPFMDYLREKLFTEIGVSEDARCLQCPGGHSWGDSGVLCTPLDMLKIARFTMNGGSWNGKQLLDREYVTAATSKLIDNDVFADGTPNSHGYGYLIWRTMDNSFMFYGMGSQLAICVPGKDIILMFNADTQGRDPVARYTIIEAFFHLIVRRAADGELPVDEAAKADLQALTDSLKLIAVAGEPHSPFQAELDGVTYRMEPNPMGITKLRFDFTERGGVLTYTNAQGDKKMPFGLCENVFDEFPQDGYPDEMATVPGNRRFRCAFSAAWVEERKLHLQAQIIDRCFGILDATFAFKGNAVTVVMNKIAEDFLDEYQGQATGYAE